MTRRLTRRDFVGAAAAAAAVPLLPGANAAARMVTGVGSLPFASPLPASPAAPSPAAPSPEPVWQESMDRDLLEVTIPRLHALYEARTYTTTQVVRWYLDRIARYNDVYRAVIHVDAPGALATAATQDAAARNGGRGFTRGALWGVPVLIKANTSVKGLVTSAGWYGYLVPGRELVAPMDATVVTRLRAAGAIILGQTNMPDFAASDSNFSTAFGRTGNAYGVRYSPGGSSGGTVTAVAANLCVLGTGTDTGNSIRMPAGTSSVVGVLPTRGLTSIAGIHPLDWLRDNTGPIARTVTDAAIALDAIAGADDRDARTHDATASAQARPYAKMLNSRALSGKRLGIPSFIVDGASLQPETRAAFTAALDGLRTAGAVVVQDPAFLPASFKQLVDAVNTQPYAAEGFESFLRDFGPPRYRSAKEYALAVGTPMPGLVRGSGTGRPPFQGDPSAEANVWAPQRRALAAFDDALDRLHLDGIVYPSAQMPPVDEIAPLLDGRRSDGPHSDTAWVNPLGLPAVVVPGGFYASGLPFGLELLTRRWRDGDLLGWAYAYEQATSHRKPPALVQKA